MELRHLRYFTAVAEEENVSRAALKLHVSQPGLSRQIRDLEDELGFPLFQRTAKSLRLTDAGRVFLIEARAVLQRADEAVQAARAIAVAGPGELRVGYAPSLAVYILPLALRAFQARFPKVRVALFDLSTEEILTQLQAGQIDVGLTARPNRRMLRGLSFRPLAEYPLRVAVPPNHRFARSKTIGLAELAGEPLITYSRQDYPEYHEQLAALFGRTRRKPKVTEEQDGVAGLVAAVEAGRGVALAPSCLVCTVGRRLKLIPLSESAPPVVFGAACQSKPESLLVEPFITAAAAVPPLE